MAAPLSKCLSKLSFSVTSCNRRLLRISSVGSLKKGYCSSNDVVEEIENEAEISEIRNKSRLSKRLKSIFLDGVPVPSDDDNPRTGNKSLYFNRKMFGRFGEKSGVHPEILWPSKEALNDQLEFEKRFSPSFEELYTQMKAKKAQELESYQQREKEVRINLAKVEIARKAMLKKIEDQEKKAMELKEKKEKLIEEVKDFLGYAINPKDPRFKELLEAKEREQKKKEKEQKKLEKKSKMMARLATLAAQSKSTSSETATENSNPKKNEN